MTLHTNIKLRIYEFLNALLYVFRYCLLCAGEEDFFIRKAIGWALRQHARNHPGSVKEFVKANENKLSNLSRREALKHL